MCFRTRTPANIHKSLNIHHTHTQPQSDTNHYVHNIYQCTGRFIVFNTNLDLRIMYIIHIYLYIYIDYVYTLYTY